MTSAVVACTMAVLGITALVLWHSYKHHSTRRFDREYAQKFDAQLALVGQLVPLRQVDEAYALERAKHDGREEPPYDWEREADVLVAALDVAYGKPEAS